MFAILFALILRPGRLQVPLQARKRTLARQLGLGLFIGGFVPSLIFGVAVGNVLQGVPFRFDPADMRIFYEGTFFGLLNPYALLCGLLSVAMLTMHGAAWLVLKSSGPVAERARASAALPPLLVIVLFALGGVFLALGVHGYTITSEVVTGGPSNPLFKTASHEGSWLANYGTHPWMLIAPIARLPRARSHVHRHPRQAGSRHAAVQQAVDLRHHLDGRRLDVPVHPALLARSEVEPDGLGCILEPPDAVHHAGGLGDLPADHLRLHGLGLQSAVGQGRREIGHRQKRSRILKEKNDVVFRMDPRPAAGSRLRRPQRHVVRADRRSGQERRRSP
jgi:hypothetical protein